MVFVIFFLDVDSIICNLLTDWSTGSVVTIVNCKLSWGGRGGAREKSYTKEKPESAQPPLRKLLLIHDKMREHLVATKVQLRDRGILSRYEYMVGFVVS